MVASASLPDDDDDCPIGADANDNEVLLAACALLWLPATEGSVILLFRAMQCDDELLSYGCMARWWQDGKSDMAGDEAITSSWANA